MSVYRLYVMSPRSGHIETYEEFEAHDDSAALALASYREIKRPAELWAPNRKVRRFECEREDQPHLFSVAG